MENTFKQSDRKLLYFLTGAVGFLSLSTLFRFVKHRAWKKDHKQRHEKGEKDETSVSEPGLKKKLSRSDKANIKKIVITGGPCGGKTTCMSKISTKLQERGYRVYIVPECATLVANGGGLINIHKMTAEENIKFQSALSNYIIDQEDRFYDMAKIFPGDAVLLCDRGVLDNRAYCPKESWDAVMDENGWSLIDLREKRYDGVIHLQTAADGAEKYYTQENNSARYESTLEDAKALDKRTKEAWAGHPNYSIVDNSHGSFDAKINKAYNDVLRFLGIHEEGSTAYSIYLLEKKGESNLPNLPNDVKTETFDILDIALKHDNTKDEAWVRKRTQNEKHHYETITVGKDEKGNRVENRKQLNGREYVAFLQNKDEKLNPVSKVRTSFLWKGRLLLIDTYNVKGGFSIIYLDSGKSVESFELPETLVFGKDVTEDKSYSTLALASL